MTQAPSAQSVPAFACDPSVRRFGHRGKLLLGGSPIRFFSLTPAGAALMDRLESRAPFFASTAESALISRWIDAGVVHPEPDLLAGAWPSEEVTLVVPVRDRAAGVERLLASLATAAGTGVAHLVEIIIVDDGSAEPFEVQIADRRLPSIQVIRCEESAGPAQARNLGLGQVSTALVAFVDSDCSVTPGWLDPLISQLGDPSVAAAAPRIAAVPGMTAVGSQTALELYESHRSPLDLGVQTGRVSAGTRVSYVPSAAVLMRTEVVRQAGGFNPALLVGEDVDLIWRLVEQGARVRYDPRSVVYHETRSALRTWMQQRVAYGTSAAALDQAHPGKVAPVILSPWSAAVWGLVAAGHLGLGATLGLGTTWMLHKKLPEVPISEVLRLGIGGHLGAGAQLARSVQRVWWPVAVPAAVLSSRARSAVAAAVVVTALDSLRDQRSELSELSELSGTKHPSRASSLSEALQFVGLGLLDDMSYGAGVWLGCLRERSLRALLPTITRPHTANSDVSGR
ncbi:MAG: mycofactocin biosynthesis glycosyltransferase MftF [Actinomycetes bacterium]